MASLVIIGLMLTVVPSNVSATTPTITNYGVIPARIDSGGTFVFWATYTSDENLAPTFMKVQRQGTTENYTMLENDTGDTTYTDGKLYYYNWYFFPYITASNWLKIVGKATGYAQVVKNLLGKSSIPFPEIRNQCVFPQENTEQAYTFAVTYWHVFNYAPNKVQIKLDETFHNMIANDTGDTTYSDGKDYHYSVNLTSGAHTFQIFVQDFPTSGNFTNGELWLIIASPTTIGISFGFMAIIGIISFLIAWVVFYALR